MVPQVRNSILVVHFPVSRITAKSYMIWIFSYFNDFVQNSWCFNIMGINIFDLLEAKNTTAHTLVHPTLPKVLRAWFLVLYIINRTVWTSDCEVFITVLCLEPRKWLVAQSIVTLMRLVWVILDLVVYKYIRRVKPLDPFCWKIKKEAYRKAFQKVLLFFYHTIACFQEFKRPKIKTIIKLNYHHAHTYPDFTDFN